MIAALGMCVQAVRDRRITVIDLGGGFGHYYGVAASSYQTRSWRWSICETPTVVGLARRTSAPAELDWILRDEACEEYDVGIASGVLQYLQDPHDGLRWLGMSCRFLILNRLPLWEIGCDEIAVQKAAGVLAYPSWFLSRSLFEEAVKAIGTVCLRWECVEDQAFFAGQRRSYAGMLIRTHA